MKTIPRDIYGRNVCLFLKDKDEPLFGYLVPLHDDNDPFDDDYNPIILEKYQDMVGLANSEIHDLEYVLDISLIEVIKMDLRDECNCESKNLCHTKFSEN